MSLYDKITQHEFIYSLLYSERIEKEPIKDQIIKINTASLKWSKDNQLCFYVWGWPGPDYNYYSINNYGRCWAFTEEEIISFWRE